MTGTDAVFYADIPTSSSITVSAPVKSTFTVNVPSSVTAGTLISGTIQPNVAPLQSVTVTVKVSSNSDSTITNVDVATLTFTDVVPQVFNYMAPASTNGDKLAFSVTISGTNGAWYTAPANSVITVNAVQPPNGKQIDQ